MSRRLPRAPRNGRWGGWRIEMHRVDGRPLNELLRGGTTADVIVIARKSHALNQPCDEIRLTVRGVEWPDDAYRKMLDHLRARDELLAGVKAA